MQIINQGESLFAPRRCSNQEVEVGRGWQESAPSQRTVLTLMFLVKHPPSLNKDQSRSAGGGHKAARDAECQLATRVKLTR